MLIPNIIKVTCGTQWLFTFDLTDPYSGDPVSIDNVNAIFKLFEGPHSTAPLWSCAWNTGIQPDPVSEGRIHVYVPGSISEFLPPGVYSYEIKLVSKVEDTYVTNYTGNVQAVKIRPTPETILGESDPVATRLVEEETKRAMVAEESLSERIAQLESIIENQTNEGEEK